MEEAKIREVQHACTELSIAYARHVDFGEYDRFVDLFTEDAKLSLGFEIVGREKIRRSMSKRSPELRSRHVMTNTFVDVLSETSAKGISYLTLYRHTGPESLESDPVSFQTPAAVGHYADEYRLTDDGWKIAERRLELAFRNPDHF
ncbi:MAG: hypothetical protein GKR90_21670 [Pseudomonadales bacterium]|nr:hypothetical protein [Pseudomonadales bacterium]